MKIPHSETENKYFLVPVILSAAAFAVQLTTNTNYGIFTDELYYIACGKHLQFGYVDHPAVAPLLARISLLLDNSLASLRLFPALSGSLTILLAALISRE